MSVSFFTPGATYHTENCPWCRDGEPCSPWCEGTVEVSDCPEMNLSNSNARVLVNMLGLSGGEDKYGEIWGEIEPAEFPTVLRVIMTALSTEACSSVATETTVDIGATRVTNENGLDTISHGPRIVTMGHDSASWNRRIEQFRELLVFASEHNLSVSWE